MTKKRLILTVALLAVGLMAMPLVMAHGNKPGSSTAEIGGGEVKVEFVGPESKGRDVLSLIQPGSYWRMGADKATTLTTDVALKFGDMTVPKGTYKLVAHFAEDKSWSLVVAEDLGGGFKPTKVVGKAPGSISKIDEEAMNMVINLKGEGNKGMLVLDWGTARMTAEFSAE